MRARPLPVDDELIRASMISVVAVSRDITTSRPFTFFDLLAAKLDIRSAVRRICASGACSDHSGTKLSISAGFF